ncbi:MAG: recombinase family protein [Lachnotalea sp.]
MPRYVRDVLDIENSAVENHTENKVVAALYVRKSLDDQESLAIQICMLEEYVHKSEDMFLYKVYSDNGFTGTNFERPAFSKLIEDMKQGKFNTIVVKDGSRLGRNYLEAGAYIESVFSTYGIRFILVNDHYDSADITCKKDGISVPLKNIMNEQYSKDLSRKLTPAFRVKQMSGAFIGGLTTYGY